MNSQAVKALSSANWKELGPRLLGYAEQQMARKKWLGLPVDVAAGKVTIAGMGAEDFVSQAIEKLAYGTRKYRTDLDLETSLRWAVRSDISNLHKQLHAKEPTEVTAVLMAGTSEGGASDADDSWRSDEQEFEPTSVAEVGAAKRPVHTPEVEETKRRQGMCLEDLYANLADDPDLQLLVMAYTDKIYKTADIATFTNIPADRISELKRKLRVRAAKFITNNPQYADVQPA